MTAKAKAARPAGERRRELDRALLHGILPSCVVLAKQLTLCAWFPYL